MNSDGLSGSRVPNGIETFRESILTGLAIVVPGLITVYVLELALGFLLRGFAPWMRLLFVLWPGVTATPWLVNALTVTVFVIVTTLIGFSVHFHAGEVAVAVVDNAISRIPGIGTLYGSVRQVTDSLVMGDHHSFQEVKLVEVPAAGHFMLGFVITQSPTAVQDSFEEDVETLFVPMAPNPVMAGFVIHVRSDRTQDVDLTVEEGISAIVSLGATEESFPEDPLQTPMMSG